MSAGAHPVLLDARDLQVEFHAAHGTLRAVNGVSLEIRAGRTLGIVGESGSGKSVLSRAMMGLLPRTARVPHGSAVFDGRDVATLSGRDKRRLWGPQISMVFQDPMTSLTPVVRIGRQLAEPLQVHLGLGRAEARARAVELLKQVGIPEPERRMSQYPHELSGGMRQRVMIAIAVSCAPRLLIADEPTTALDVTIQQQVLNLLGRLQQENGMAMVLVTHDLGLVAHRTDEVATMYAGRVVEQGPTRVLFREMRHPYTRALFASIPRLRNPSHTRLTAIPGRPPALTDHQVGCSFAARCPNVGPRCRSEVPMLEPGADPSHRFACFHPAAGAVPMPEGIG